MANWLSDYKTSFEWTANSTMELIEKYEGMRTRAYQDSQGNWTIGVGHLIRTEERYMLHRELSEGEVRDLLYRDLEKCSTALKTAIRVPITPQQRDAMQSLCHNIGPDNMAKSDVIKHLNKGKLQQAANAFMNWSNPPDLIKRRQYERKLFLSSI
jgi:lysozyme